MRRIGGVVTVVELAMSTIVPLGSAPGLSPGGAPDGREGDPDAWNDPRSCNLKGLIRSRSGARCCKVTDLGKEPARFEDTA
jgi:hypothetical protein